MRSPRFAARAFDIPGYDRYGQFDAMSSRVAVRVLDFSRGDWRIM